MRYKLKIFVKVPSLTLLCLLINKNKPMKLAIKYILNIFLRLYVFIVNDINTVIYISINAITSLKFF